MLKRWWWLSLLFLLLAACTVDENGIRDPVAEAKAQATRTQTEIDKRNAEVDLSIRERTALMETQTREVELKIKQLEAETQAHRDRVIADAEAEAKKQTLLVQAQTLAQVAQSLGIALSAVLMLGAAGAVIWVAGLSISRTRNAVLASGYVKIGVDPVTMQPPPLIITSDGFLVDTRSGERARLRDRAGVDRMRVAATTHSTNVAILARTATELARAARGQAGTAPSPAAQVAEVLPQLAGSVPMIDHTEREVGLPDPRTASAANERLLQRLFGIELTQMRNMHEVKEERTPSRLSTDPQRSQG